MVNHFRFKKLNSININFFRLVWCFVSMCLTIDVLTLFALSAKKSQMQQQIQPQLNLNINNVATNEPMVKSKAVIALFIAFITTVLPTATIGLFGVDDLREIMYIIFFVMYCSLVTLLPALYFLNNPRKFKMALEILLT